MQGASHKLLDCGARSLFAVSRPKRTVKKRFAGFSCSPSGSGTFLISIFLSEIVLFLSNVAHFVISLLRSPRLLFAILLFAFSSRFVLRSSFENAVGSKRAYPGKGALSASMCPVNYFNFFRPSWMLRVRAVSFLTQFCCLSLVDRRRGTVKTIEKITGVMKLVAQAQLMRDAKAAARAAPYFTALQPFTDKLPENKKDGKKVLTVLVTSNRGLCGALNAALIRETVRSEEFPKSSGVFIYGDKGATVRRISA